MSAPRGNDEPLGDLAPATLTVKAGRPDRTPDAPLNPPVVLASTFVHDGPMQYGRYANPTWSAFEEALGALEGGTALCFASGMATVSAVLAQLPVGATVVVSQHAYLGTLSMLREYDESKRLTTLTVDITDVEAVLKAAEGADLVWIESPTNPALEVADIPTIATGARTAGAAVVVDNTFATPLLQRPLDLGADVVVHSATKYLSGHSDVLLGAAVTRDQHWHERLLAYRSGHGTGPGPFETYLALRGLRTLHLRVERAQSNATVLAERLADHPGIDRVRYPGMGGIICVELPDVAAADRLCASTRIWVNTTSLGGVESTLERRRRWPSEATTIPETLVRLSVGIEDVEDLWADLAQALRDHEGNSGP